MSEKSRDWIWLILVLIVLAGIAVPVVLTTVLPLLMFQRGGWYMSGMMGMMGFGWWFMPLVSIIFLVLIALGAYYLITEFSGTGRSPPSHREKALEILKERYARGEITKDEYVEMKEDLEA